MSATAEVFREIANVWTPPSKLTVSAWADANRRLSREASAQTGEWKTRPYQREPMDEFTNPAVHTIVLMVARQTLKTECINNCLGYVIDQDPGPTLLVQFRDTDCKRYSKIRLAPMLRDTPCLHGKVADDKSRTTENTIDYKSFAGGHLSIVASGSPGNLAALPIRYLFCDEIDKYPVTAGAAGDPISLAQGRQEEFWNRKTVLACTPTSVGLSRIAIAYEASDQREYEVPCPDCGAYQILIWSQVQWDTNLPAEKRAQSARYVCQYCKANWGDVQRWNAIKRGRYRATKPFNGIAGFRVSGLCRLGTKLSAIAGEFLAKKDYPEALRTFVNEQLAELWQELGEEPPDDEKLWLRAQASPRPDPLPEEVLFVVAGVDVQADRLEVQIRGWGRRKRSWLVGYEVISGKPQDDATWAALDGLLVKTFRHSLGMDMPILRVGIDSGYAAQEVYAWARQQKPGWVVVTKGFDSGVGILGQPKTADLLQDGKRQRRGVKIWPVNVSMMKSELYGWLKQPIPAEGQPFPPGFLHDYDAGREYFAQLCSEVFTYRIVKGFRKGEWVKKRERNEALDTFGECRAAAEHLGISRFSERDWKALEGYVGAGKTEQARAEAQDSTPIVETAERQPEKPKPWISPSRSRGSWINGGRR